MHALSFLSSLFASFICIMTMTGCSSQSQPSPESGDIQAVASGDIFSLPGSLCIDDTCFRLRYATTPDQREQGLMGVTDLKDDEGMLFDFGTPKLSAFWMKNTLIPLDIIWLDDTWTVQGIRNNAPPCPPDTQCTSRGPGIPTRFVLEIPGGIAEKQGIATGSVFVIGQ